MNPSISGTRKIAAALSVALLAGTSGSLAAQSAGSAAENKILRFSSVATRGGMVSYVEKHESEYRDGKIYRARTDYLRENGEPLAYIESCFTESLAAPAHVFEDYRNGFHHGVRYEKGAAVLFSFDPGTDEKENRKEVALTGDGEILMVGCQGLFYYLQEYYQEAKLKGRVPLKLLITGTREVYDFELEVRGERNGVAELTIHIQNRFLRLFAPKLEVRYDIGKKRMLWYKGLSNIQDDRGKIQTVEIVYDYAD